jgi:hypothetical protein
MEEKRGTGVQGCGVPGKEAVVVVVVVVVGFKTALEHTSPALGRGRGQRWSSTSSVLSVVAIA